MPDSVPPPPQPNNSWSLAASMPASSDIGPVASHDPGTSQTDAALAGGSAMDTVSDPWELNMPDQPQATDDDPEDPWIPNPPEPSGSPVLPTGWSVATGPPATPIPWTMPEFPPSQTEDHSRAQDIAQQPIDAGSAEVQLPGDGGTSRTVVSGESPSAEPEDTLRSAIFRTICRKRNRDHLSNPRAQPVDSNRLRPPTQDAALTVDSWLPIKGCWYRPGSPTLKRRFQRGVDLAGQFGSDGIDRIYHWYYGQYA